MLCIKFFKIEHFATTYHSTLVSFSQSIILREFRKKIKTWKYQVFSHTNRSTFSSIIIFYYLSQFLRNCIFQSNIHDLTSIRNIMNNVQLHQIYIENVNVLYSNLFKNIDVDINDLVFRDVKLWVKHVKRFQNLKTSWILDVCLQNFVKQWFDIHSISKTLKSNHVKFICFFLIKKFVITKQKQKIENELAWKKLIKNITLLWNN